MQQQGLPSVQVEAQAVDNIFCPLSCIAPGQIHEQEQEQEHRIPNQTTGANAGLPAIEFHSPNPGLPAATSEPQRNGEIFAIARVT
jgi:hypothetical protein